MQLTQIEFVDWPSMFVKLRVLYNFDPVIYQSSIMSVFNLSPSSAILYQKLNFNDRLSVPRPCQPVPGVWVQEAGANNTTQFDEN